MAFSERLQELLLEKSVSWKKVSEDLRIGINQKRYWETHGNVPDGETIKKLAAYFGVSAAYLMGETDERGQKESPASDDTGDMLERKLSLLSEAERNQIEKKVDELLIKRLSASK